MLSLDTRSYIRYDGKKVYLHEKYKDLKFKLKYASDTVELSVSGILTNKKRVFLTKKITDYGEAGF